MRTIGNILWLVLAGFWLAIGYAVAGLLAFVLIITIPFGIASFRLAGFVLWPFGRTVVWRRDAGVLSLIGNIVWIIFFGWELALAHLFTGLLLCITIIGIPFGVACWKMVPLSLVPLGRRERADQLGGHRPLWRTSPRASPIPLNLTRCR